MSYKLVLITTSAQCDYWKSILQAIDNVLQVPQNYEVKCTIYITVLHDVLSWILKFTFTCSVKLKVYTTNEMVVSA